MATPGSVPNVVDSSGWIEYLTDSANADAFAPAIEDTSRLIVPSLALLEVFKWVLRMRGEETALDVTAMMQQGHVVELDARLSLEAARLGAAHGLPLAHSVIYATARACGALLWTQDADFEGLTDVRYWPK